MVPLTGTTNSQHMMEDLDIFSIDLTPDEVDLIESIAG
jgi:diketogulonate reductase-like aldo/keto reductase